MGRNRTERAWKLHRGKAVTDDGVAAIARKHEDRAARHRGENEIVANPAPTTEGLGRVSHFVQDAIERLRKFLG
jgi:hypothetical protein